MTFALEIIMHLCRYFISLLVIELPFMSHLLWHLHLSYYSIRPKAIMYLHCEFTSQYDPCLHRNFRLAFCTSAMAFTPQLLRALSPKLF
jgi:hypothetical protein